MTISRKEKMLQIISELETYRDELSDQTRAKLTAAKKKLSEMNEAKVELISNRVVSQPAPQQEVHLRSPENLLHDCYEEVNRLSMAENAPYGLQEVVQQVRNYFNIEEQDGFFP